MLLRHTTAKEIDRKALTINPAKNLSTGRRNVCCIGYPRMLASQSWFARMLLVSPQCAIASLPGAYYGRNQLIFRRFVSIWWLSQPGYCYRYHVYGL